MDLDSCILCEMDKLRKEIEELKKGWKEDVDKMLEELRKEIKGEQLCVEILKLI